MDHEAAAAPAAMDRISNRISYGVGCASTALAKPQHCAKQLNVRKVATARGGRWTHVLVRQIMDNATAKNA